MNCDEKKIIISGTNNRYLVNKLIKSKSEIEIRKRKVIEKWGVQSDCFTDEKQELLLEELYNSIYFIDSIESNNSCTTNFDLIKLELNKKISSYKQQDIIRGFYEPEKFITINSIVKNLYDCKLECYYCTQKMVILYEIVREMKQWSVDRINNNLGHNRDNIVIACLDCNLKRRRTGKAAFLFTKQLNIIKGV
jgi:hypothetical protein